jgi:hypothetical protein
MFKGAASWLGVGNGRSAAEAIYEPHDGDENCKITFFMSPIETS